MAISLQHETDNVYRVEMTGVLQKADLRACESALAGELRATPRVKLLFVLKDFLGWDPESDWNDLTFYVTHGDAIDRIAIVADPRWQTEAFMFAAAGLRRAPVEFFRESDITAARAWLQA